MASPHEIVNAYVDPSPIYESLTLTQLPESELEIAVASIQRDRAQWVVNSMVQEISDREAALQAENQRLSTELQTVQASITIARGILDRYSPYATALASERITNRIAQYTKRHEPFERVFKNEAPFAFTLPKQVESDSFSFPSMRLWVLEHQEALQEVYGTPISKSMVRMMNSFDREFSSPYDQHYNPKKYIAENDVMKDNGDTYTFTVTNPYQFLDALLDLRNFGVTSGIALLCVADYQALEASQHFKQATDS